MVIYADILLLVNGWIDFLLLLGVRRMLGLDARPWRMAAGSLVGAASAFVLFLPPLPVWLSLAVKLGMAALMVLVTFAFAGWRAFVRQMVLLFGLSAGLAGLTGALYFFAAPAGVYAFNGVVYYAVPPLLLVGLTVLCYVAFRLGEWWLRRRAPKGHRYSVRISYGGRTVSALCLYDSGNHLTEPFSNRPVLVVERRVAEQLLTVPRSLADWPPPESAGWRMVPFDSLGGGGVLPAFEPEEVLVCTPRGEEAVRCYVAVCNALGRGEYEGLLGSALGDQFT